MNVPKKVLFIDRDGTIIVEPPDTFQIDSFEKLEFLPGVISSLRNIVEECGYELVMVTNQDGLGTESFPEETFYPVHNLMLKTLENEGIRFSEICIDRSFDHTPSPNRKPATGMLTQYIEGAKTGEYDFERSFVIGDRMTDVHLALNLGVRAIRYSTEITPDAALVTTSWAEIYRFLRTEHSDAVRSAAVYRRTNETEISIRLTLDGAGTARIHTGIGFLDHMLEQLARHSGCDLDIHVTGDTWIDEHHTIEDTGLALGEAFAKALGDKRGIERYGFSLLPMDEAFARVALDFSGRPWLVWSVPFSREKIGEVPTEMFEHFFKSLCDTAKWTLNIEAQGSNDHHIIEAVFKAVARSVSMAKHLHKRNFEIPSTKGIL